MSDLEAQRKQKSEVLHKLMLRVRDKTNLTCFEAFVDLVFGSLKLVLLVGPLLAILCTTQDLTLQACLFMLWAPQLFKSLGHPIIELYYGSMAGLLLSLFTIFKTIEILPSSSQDSDGLNPYHLSTFGLQNYAWGLVFMAEVAYALTSIFFFKQLQNIPHESYVEPHKAPVKHFEGMIVLVLVCELIRIILAVAVTHDRWVVMVFELIIGLILSVFLEHFQTRVRQPDKTLLNYCPGDLFHGGGGVFVFYAYLHLATVLQLEGVMYYVTGVVALVILGVNIIALHRSTKLEIAAQEKGDYAYDYKHTHTWIHNTWNNKLRLVYVGIAVFGVICFLIDAYSLKPFGLLFIFVGLVSALFDQDEIPKQEGYKQLKTADKKRVDKASETKNIWVTLFTSRVVWMVIFMTGTIFLMAGNLDEPYYTSKVTFPDTLKTPGCTVQGVFDNQIHAVFNLINDPHYMGTPAARSSGLLFPISMQLIAFKIAATLFIYLSYPMSKTMCEGKVVDFIVSDSPIALMTFGLMAIIIIMLLSQTYKYGLFFVNSELFWPSTFLVTFIMTLTTQLLGDIDALAYNYIIPGSHYDRSYSTWGYYAVTIQSFLLLASMAQCLLPPERSPLAALAEEEVSKRNYFLADVLQFATAPGNVIQVVAVLLLLGAAAAGSPLKSIKLVSQPNNDIPIWARINANDGILPAPNNATGGAQAILENMITEQLAGPIFYFVDTVAKELPHILSDTLGDAKKCIEYIGCVHLDDILPLSSLTSKIADLVSPLLHTLGDGIGHILAQQIISAASSILPIITAAFEGVVTILSSLSFTLFDINLNIAPTSNTIWTIPMWVVIGFLGLQFLTLHFKFLVSFRTMAMMAVCSGLGVVLFTWYLVKTSLDTLGYGLSLTYNNNLYTYILGMSLAIFGLALSAGYAINDEEVHTKSVEDVRVIMELQRDAVLETFQMASQAELAQLEAQHKEEKIKLQQSLVKDSINQKNTIATQTASLAALAALHAKEMAESNAKMKLAAEQAEAEILKQKTDLATRVKIEREKLSKTIDENTRAVKEQLIAEEALQKQRLAGLESKKEANKKDLERKEAELKQRMAEREKSDVLSKEKALLAVAASSSALELQSVKAKQKVDEDLEAAKVKALEKERSDKQKAIDVEAKAKQNLIKQEAEIKKAEEVAKQKVIDEEKKKEEAKIAAVATAKKKVEAEEKAQLDLAKKLEDNKRKADVTAKEKVIADAKKQTQDAKDAAAKLEKQKKDDVLAAAAKVKQEQQAKEAAKLAAMQKDKDLMTDLATRNKTIVKEAKKLEDLKVVDAQTNIKSAVNTNNTSYQPLFTRGSTKPPLYYDSN